MAVAHQDGRLVLVSRGRGWLRWTPGPRPMGEAVMTERKNYRIAQLDQLPGVPCPCGTAKRAFTADPEGTASIHEVEIKRDSEVHFHRRQTEIYYVLEGEGYIELDGERHPLRPGTSVLIKPGCRHRAVGNLRILNLVVPAFDPADEHVD